jgi:DNA-binding MarR family transcriptional regulator
MGKNDKVSKSDQQEHDLAEELRPRLLRISQALRREAKHLPITRTQSAVLSALLIGKPMRLSDLARAEAVTLPTMNQVINRMLLSGWVTRVSTPGSAPNLIDITDEGRKVATEAAALRNATLIKRIHQLSPEEQRSMRQILPVIDKMFSKEPWITDPAADES